MPPSKENVTMFQYFEWYTPADHKHWKRLKEQAPLLKSLGLTALWLPPPTKGGSRRDVGYGAYDLWDLGEFDQKGTVPTKYGTRQELQEAIEACHEQGIQVYFDIVLNHKGSGDETETFMAKVMDEEDRRQEIQGPHEIKAYTRFTFPGRKGKYSDLVWGHPHFSGTDWDAKRKRKAIFQIVGENKGFAEDVDDEKGNFDFLMCCNIDYSHPEVVQETEKWARWLVDEFKVDGFRIDAIRHISYGFITHFISFVRTELDRPEFFCVGEWWREDLSKVDTQEGNDSHFHLFDIRLHVNFHQASTLGSTFDLQTIFDGTLVQSSPESAVTFIDNHDTQPYQAVESFVEDWFKPLAAALVLLRFDGFPCIFYGDMFGIEPKSRDKPETAVPGKKVMFTRLLLARKAFAYGAQTDYLDHPSCIGWVRHGEKQEGDVREEVERDENHAKGLAVVMSNSNSGHKRMNIGLEHAGQIWVDIMGHWKEPVTIEDDGWASFDCHGRSLSVYAEKIPGKSWKAVQESTPKCDKDCDEYHPDLPQSLESWDHLLEDD